METAMKRSLYLAGTILAAALLAPVAAQADSPRAFLHNALRGDNSEIMLGQLAAERGRSQGVRDFGRTLVADHSKARAEVLDVGRRFGIRPDREVKPEARMLRDRLMNMRGREFDREFIDHMVEDHRNDVAEFRDEARERHGAVSDLAARQLPTLREHLRTARALDRSQQQFSDASDWNHRGWRDRNYDRDRDHDRDRNYDRDRDYRSDAR
jgi:putative membrane protein